MIAYHRPPEQIQKECFFYKHPQDPWEDPKSMTRSGEKPTNELMSHIEALTVFVVEIFKV